DSYHVPQRLDDSFDLRRAPRGNRILTVREQVVITVQEQQRLRMLLREHVWKPGLAVSDVLPANSPVRHDDSFVWVRAVQEELQFGRVRTGNIDDLEAKCDAAVLSLRHAVAEREITRYGDLHTRQGHVERAHRLTRRCVCRCADHRSRANGKRRARRRSTRDRDGRSSRLSGWCFEGHWLRRTDCSANGDVHGTRDARWVARRARTGRAAATCRRCGSEREERKKAVSRQESQEAHGVIILEAVVRAPAVIL